jgi:hypothetical protein
MSIIKAITRAGDGQGESATQDNERPRESPALGPA